MDISDLRNYLNVGGTVFLVVYVDEDGDNSQIYYNTLLPFELRRLVSRYGEQKSKQIELKALSKKKSDIADHEPKRRPDMQDQFRCRWSESGHAAAGWPPGHSARWFG